ncbi:phenylacetone monooxygenase [Colletotrichum tofieldiae]|nr:phenylacetone monooxygenase [Colletotrichum tofieldiae]
MQFLTKKFDLKKDMQFNTRIKSARFQEDSKSWLLTDSTGGTHTCRYLVTAMGILNKPTLPNIPEEMQDIRLQYPKIFQKCLDSYSCFIHISDKRSVFDMEDNERLKHWEALYALPGFTKIRQRVHDPNIVEKLIPKNLEFGTRRVPLESGYYEVFNLVDLNEDPIERITDTGIKTQDEAFEFDVIIYATVYDAVTGSFRAVDFQGIGDTQLSDV